MLTDTHCHLNMCIKKEFDVLLPPCFQEMVEPFIQEAQKKSVTTIINVGTSVIESKNCIALAHAFPGTLYATIGTHPNDGDKESWQHDVATYRELLQHDRQDTEKKEKIIVGIGETGLDFYREGYDKELQYALFKEQIEIALEYSLPIIVHTRHAHDEVLKVIAEYKQHNLRGIIHCFSEEQTFAQHAIDLGFLLGIGGTITYPKNEYLREVVRTVGLDAIVLETDAPFLPPQEIQIGRAH